MRVLLVKMSSLGDVIHALPAVSDAAGHGVRFDWVVEEAFAEIPARHPAVDRVLPIAWRRWRRNLRRDRQVLGAFVSELRERRYDLILDAQGLFKSAAVTALARGSRRAGFSRSSAREGGASLFYGQPLAVPREQHAVVRLRQLFAAALGYPTPADDSPLDYGIAPARGPGPPNDRCALLHGTTWHSKHWPLRFWQDLARRVRGEGFTLALPAGNESELTRALDIGGPEATVWNRIPLGQLMDALAGCRLAIGVDSGLSHLAAALALPTLVLYGSTSSRLTGCRGPRVRNLQAEFPCAPCLNRVCNYRGAPVLLGDNAVEPPCFSTLPPDRVWREAQELIDADRLLHL
jgi:heptosyltransferase-1